MENGPWRRACKTTDTALTILIFDPMVRLVLPLVLRAGVRPNWVTCGRFAIAVLGAFLFWRGMFVAGALCFPVWYFFDCIDGKIARLTGAASTFGDWLDRMTDRLGVFLLLFALSLEGMSRGDQAQVALAFGLCGCWLLRVMNGDRLTWIMKRLEKEEVGRCRSSEVPELRTGLANFAPRYSAWAARSRLTTWVVHDVEWLLIALTIGPLFNQVIAGLAFATVSMVLQEAVRVVIFWWRRMRAIQVADLRASAATTNP